MNKKLLSDVGIYFFGFLIFLFALGFLLFPSIYLGKQILYYNSIKSNGEESIATVIDTETKSYKTRKGYRYTSIQTIDFDSYRIEKSLSGGSYSPGDQFLIVYNRLIPNELYIGKLNDSIFSILNDNEDYITFIFIWLLVSPFGLFFLIKGAINIISEFVSESVIIKRITNSFVRFLPNKNDDKHSNIFSKISYFLRFLLIIFIFYGLSDIDLDYYEYDLEINFFDLFRWILSISFLYLIMYFRFLRDFNWTLIFIIMLIVFNPIIPFSFNGDIWTTIDLMVIVALVLSFFSSAKSRIVNK